MRILNPDGSEPAMCGNGLRCAALFTARSKIRIQTRAGIVNGRVNKKNCEIKIRMSLPRNIRLNLPLKINKRLLKVNFINSGVPHTVIFVHGLDIIDVVALGRQIRFHKRFMPQGTNVDFVQMVSDNRIQLRTYERGVEDETLACGTGAVAAALISDLRYAIGNRHKVRVNTKSGEVLQVEFSKINNKFQEVWLEGKARIVYSGVYYV